MTPEEARQLVGLDSGFSPQELENAFRRRFQEWESKIERAPTPGLKEKYRRNLNRLEEAWEVLTDRDHVEEADNFPALRPVVVEKSQPPENTAASPVFVRERVQEVRVVNDKPAIWKTLAFQVGAVAVLILITALVCWGLFGSTNELIGASAPKAGQSWTNSLGMNFVPAGTEGVLFCAWDVRVKDYGLFVKETGKDLLKPDFGQTENDPVVNVSLDDAHAFCDWLTKKEQAEGRLRTNEEYRLPTDAEWSRAVGLTEQSDGTPKDKDGKVYGVYPWGTQWPPPQGAGNYAESLTHDGFANTSPVGSFAANAYQLYDMAGNVWQWCEDDYGVGDKRVARGGSWETNFPDFSSNRRPLEPTLRDDETGFRLALVVPSYPEN